MKERLQTVEFIEDVFEIAFGDNAVNKDYTYDDVIIRLREFSDKALASESVPTNVIEGINDVCQELGASLSQEEVDCLLTKKNGGMYDV
tara:strand:+ start:4396 stop:4662 length:267 start_codon:yes stop_codon:yes gene_type:complete